MNVRELAYKSLIKIEKDKKYSSLELDAVISSVTLSAADRALFTVLLYGVTEKRLTLDYTISLFSSKPVNRLDLSTLILLRLGAYQLLFLDKIPQSAAVNETVKLAAIYSARSKGFINAVLRKVTSLSVSGDDFPYPDKNKNPVGYYSVKYSLPAWICMLWRRDYPGEGEKLFEFANSAPYITLRVNTLKTDVKSVTEMFGGRCKPCENAPYGVRFTERISIDELNLNGGFYYVQDEASQIAGAVLDARPGMTVADVCSCPGGKAFSAAMYMENKGSIFAFDLHKSKLTLITDGASQLGISIIKAAEHDSEAVDSSLIASADRVICDVPCSGLGVIAKKSDLRYRDESTLGSLPELQYSILSASSRYVKPEGVIVYSTCTLRRVENEDVVTRFLNNNPDFSLLPFSVGSIESSGMLTLFPHINGTDGFFISKLVKH